MRFFVTGGHFYKAWRAWDECCPGEISVRGKEKATSFYVVIVGEMKGVGRTLSLEA